MPPVRRDLFDPNTPSPPTDPIFRGVRTVWLLDGCCRKASQLLQDEVVDRHGLVDEDLLSVRTTHIVALDWGAVILRWSWRWIIHVMTMEGVVIVDPDWVRDSLAENCLQNVDDYEIYEPWEQTKHFIIEKVETDAMQLPDPEQYPYESLVQRTLFTDMEKSLFLGVRALFVDKGIDKWELEHYKREIVEHQGELHDTLSENTTHLICKKYSYACVKFGPNTMRRAMKVRGKLWAISPHWVRISLIDRKLAYEVNFDEHFKVYPTAYTP